MKNDSWAQALRIMASLSSWIAFPVIIAVFVGKWLDRKFATDPWLFLASVGLAFLVSMYGLIINAQKEFKKIADLGNQAKDKNNKNQTDNHSDLPQ